MKKMPKGAGIGMGVALGLAIGAGMHNVGVGLAIGIAMGAAFETQGSSGYCWPKKKKDTEAAPAEPINPAQVEAKAKHIAHVLKLAKEKGSITNDDVQASIGVSDATAERYLAELEREGKLKQKGFGRGVRYEPRN